MVSKVVEAVGTERPRSIRARAVVLSFLFAPLICYAVTQQTISTVFSLIVAPVGLLLVLVLLNAPPRRLLPKAALSQADLIVIFSLSAIAASVGAEFSFVGQAGMHEYAFETSNPTARDFFLKYLPDWLTFKDKTPIADMEGGGRGFMYVVHKLPILFPKYVPWVALLSLICWTMLCANSLMRQMWCQSERLSFPLIQLPVAVAEKGGAGAIWRNKAMWAAFLIMFGIDMMNGFNYLFPNIPSMPTKTLFDVGALFKEQPWKSIGSTPIAIYPFLAVIGFFMPSDMLFSVILFYLVRKATHVALAMYGLPQGLDSGTFASPGPPYRDEQSWGAVIALFAAAMMFSKGYLKQVWRDIVSGAKAEDGGLPHRWAFIGFIACFFGVMWFGMQGSISAGYLAVYVGLYIVFSVVLTRMRAQIGTPTHEFAHLGPGGFLNCFLGTNRISDKQLTWIDQLYLVMTRIHRNNPMPYQLEAIKMGSLNRLNQRSLFWCIALMTPLAILLAYFLLDVWAYRTGVYWNWNDANHYLRMVLEHRSGPNLVGITMTLVGFTVVMLLDTARFRFPGFLLHPAGYLFALEFSVDYYWFGLLLALIIKVFVQRYYGLRGYDKLRAIAIGILVGEYAAETIWLTVALITRQSTYTISVNDRSLGKQ
jgi:hypothetical protein